MSNLAKPILVLLLLIPIVFFAFKHFQTDQSSLKKTNQANIQTPSLQTSSKILQTFILLGDTGTAATAQFDVASAIEDYCLNKTCLAAFIAGDVIYNDGVGSVNDSQFTTKFEQPYQNLNFPFYIAFGNHDYRGCIICYQQYSEISPKWNMPASYYKTQFENIEFFIIDTENFNAEQSKWLIKQLASSNSKWKVVIGHRPLKTYEQSYLNEKWNGRGKLKDIICSKSDIYVAGHAHLLEFVRPIEDCQVVQIVSGSGGSSPRRISKNPKSEFFFEGNGFAALTINQDLDLEFLDSQGQSLFRTTIKN